MVWLGVVDMRPSLMARSESAVESVRRGFGQSFQGHLTTYNQDQPVRHLTNAMSNPTKLTLRLDEGLIDRAKSYALEQDRSLSQLVADYFAHLTVMPKATGKARPMGKSADQTAGPITTGLRGALLRPVGKAQSGKTSTGRDEYRAYLEGKYL